MKKRRRRRTWLCKKGDVVLDDWLIRRYVILGRIENHYCIFCIHDSAEYEMARVGIHSFKLIGHVDISNKALIGFFDLFTPEFLD